MHFWWLWCLGNFIFSSDYVRGREKWMNAKHVLLYHWGFFCCIFFLFKEAHSDCGCGALWMNNLCEALLIPQHCCFVVRWWCLRCEKMKMESEGKKKGKWSTKGQISWHFTTLAPLLLHRHLDYKTSCFWLGWEGRERMKQWISYKQVMACLLHFLLTREELDFRLVLRTYFFLLNEGLCATCTLFTHSGSLLT